MKKALFCLVALALILVSCKPTDESLRQAEAELRQAMESDFSSLRVDDDNAYFCSFPDSSRVYIFLDRGVDVRSFAVKLGDGKDKTLCGWLSAFAHEERDWTNDVIPVMEEQLLEKKLDVGGKMGTGMWPVFVSRHLEGVFLERTVTQLDFGVVQRKKRGEYTYFVPFNATVKERIGQLDGKGNRFMGTPIGHLTPSNWFSDIELRALPSEEKERILEQWKKALPQFWEDAAIWATDVKSGKRGSLVPFNRAEWVAEENSIVINGKLFWHPKKRRWEMEKEFAPIPGEVHECVMPQRFVGEPNVKAGDMNLFCRNGIYWENSPLVQEGIRQLAMGNVWMFGQWMGEERMRSLSDASNGYGNIQAAFDAAKKELDSKDNLELYMTRLDAIFSEAENVVEQWEKAQIGSSSKDGQKKSYHMWMPQFAGLMSLLVQERFNALVESGNILDAFDWLLENRLNRKSWQGIPEEVVNALLEKGFEELPHSSNYANQNAVFLRSEKELLSRAKIYFGHAGRISSSLDQRLELFCQEYFGELTQLLVDEEMIRYLQYWRLLLMQYLPDAKKNHFLSRLDRLMATINKQEEWKQPEEIPEIVEVMSSLMDAETDVSAKVDGINSLCDMLSNAVYHGWIDLKHFESAFKAILGREISMPPVAERLKLDLRRLENNAEYQEAKKKWEQRLEFYTNEAEKKYPLVKPGDKLACVINGAPHSTSFLSYDRTHRSIRVMYAGKPHTVPLRQIVDKSIHEENLDEDMTKNLRERYLSEQMKASNTALQGVEGKILLEECKNTYQQNIVCGYLPAICNKNGKLTLARGSIRELAEHPEAWTSAEELLSQMTKIAKTNLAHTLATERKSFLGQ